ncbi:MAG: NUDIX domain-containing protein [Chloroflexota bacterium]|nr:NUDIX domain-containing protein [Chloroflexota bacterium]
MRLRYEMRRLYWRTLRPTTLGSRCLVLSQDDAESVLLVKHTYERWWYMPGGGVEKGESFASAARREVWEETGLEVRDLSLFGLYHNTGEGKDDHVALYVSRSFSGTPKIGCREIEQVGFYPLRDLPANTSPATRRRIAEYLSGCPASVW